MDAREVCILITGAHKAIALSKCIEEGVNHMWTVSAIQMHPKGMIVCDEDATLELHVKVRHVSLLIILPHRALFVGKELIAECSKMDDLLIYRKRKSLIAPLFFFIDRKVLQVYRTRAKHSRRSRKCWLARYVS